MFLRLVSSAGTGDDERVNSLEYRFLTSVSVPSAVLHVAGVQPLANLLIALQQLYLTDRQMPGWYVASILAPASIAANNTLNAQRIRQRTQHTLTLLNAVSR